MYNPPRFKSNNTDEAVELMQQNPFATLITIVEGEPVISHLPLTVKKVTQNNKEEIFLIGHLAKPNPQSKVLGSSTVRVIFQGAHTYITPQWYQESDVPTWNYSAVHIKGEVEMIEDVEGVLNCLRELVAHSESLWPSGWQFFVPKDLSGDLLTRRITGFKIKVTEINYKKKLNQGSSPVDRLGVIRGLEARSDENSHRVREDMQKLFDEAGEIKSTEMSK